MFVQKHRLSIIQRSPAIERLSSVAAGTVCRLIFLKSIFDLRFNHLNWLHMKIEVSVHLLSNLLWTVFENIVVKFDLVAVISTIDLNSEQNDIFVLTGLSWRLLLMTNLVNC